MEAPLSYVVESLRAKTIPAQGESLAWHETLRGDKKNARTERSAFAESATVRARGRKRGATKGRECVGGAALDIHGRCTSTRPSNHAVARPEESNCQANV